jgi:hypothetical protein
MNGLWYGTMFGEGVAFVDAGVPVQTGDGARDND